VYVKTPIISIHVGIDDFNSRIVFNCAPGYVKVTIDFKNNGNETYNVISCNETVYQYVENFVLDPSARIVWYAELVRNDDFQLIFNVSSGEYNKEIKLPCEFSK